MISSVFTTEQITAYVGSYIWPLMRILGLIATAPLFNTRAIPTRIKLTIALALTLAVAPNIDNVPAVDPFSLASLGIIFHQIAIGVIMGYVLQLVFNAFIVASQIIAMQVGLGFAQMVDPASGINVPVLSQFYTIMVTLIFFSLNAHLVLIELILDSFAKVPIGTTSLSLDNLWRVVTWITYVFVSAVLLALPAIASIKMVNITLGVVTRAAPQFNIFSIGFPISIILGYLIVGITLPVLLSYVVVLTNDAFLFISQIFSLR